MRFCSTGPPWAMSCSVFWMQEDVAFLQRHQPLLPVLGDRALLGQQGSRAELEDDLAELGIVDPILPFLQIPDAAGHDDRDAVGNAALAHHLAKLLDSRIGV